MRKPNNMAQEKMSVEKKTKMVYSGELLVFAILFAVIATLEIIGVIGKREIMLIIFNWVTIFGGTWMIIDCVWVLCSKKRRKKNSLLDKFLLIPLGIYLITFDIICFSQLSFVTIEFRRMMMSIAFYYLAAIYLFQSIYHYFYPIPAIIEAIEEEKKEKEQALVSETKEAQEKKDEEEKPQD